ncbi:MAG TPA: ETC complex I subunit [Dongiaceae bacterium]|jgi:hypothetical protein|nr:ETC complex I subunit [Dongiaceae bacterium]
MSARIYRPAKNAMQSGWGNTQKWVLEYAPEVRKKLDPIMGWTGSSDTRRQFVLRFSTKEEAIAYAEKEGIPYQVEEFHTTQIRPKAYADNFRTDRKGNWTH